MELHVTRTPVNKHTELVAGASWSGNNELLTVGDDKLIWLWNVEGEPLALTAEVEICATSLRWHPTASGGRGGGETFVLACVDGSFKLMSKQGRVEKSVPAHTGALTAVGWSHDGTSLATAGEDGAVKSWSRNGMFRANLAQAEGTVYAMCWSPDSDQILYSSGKHLVIRPLQPSAKQTMWKAHDAPVLCLDWNPVNGLIVSGGEDCKYRIWDCYGRQLYCSAAVEYSITSVAWAPNGRYFAVGSFNMLRLCDKTGWSYSREQPTCGSVFALAWTADSTQVAASTGSGAVLFGQLVHRELSCGPFEVRQEEPASLTVVNVVEDSSEDLTFKDRVTEMSLSTTHLVVITASQCCIYATSNWNTPHIIEQRGTVSLIMQCATHFLMVDTINGLQVLNYDGRQLSKPRFQGMRQEVLCASNVAYCQETVAMVDHSDPKSIRLFDPLTAKQLGGLQHSIDVEVIAISQGKGPRRLALVDKNRDMYLTPTQGAQELNKLQIMVDTVRWCEDNTSLAAVADGHLVVWYYPETVLIDRDILPLTLLRQPAPELGKTSEILDFRGTRVTLRRSDGAVVVMSVSPYPSMLERFCSANEWEPALRLCRYVKSKQLWAVLAAMAVAGKELHTAEVAYAAIEEVDKLLFMCHIKELPTAEAREAELLLFRRRHAEAVQVLVQGGWIYRAIKMCIHSFAWEKAYDLARQHAAWLDVVLFHRQKFLRAVNKEETLPKLMQLAHEMGTVDEGAMRAKILAEKTRESERGGMAG